MQKILFLFSLIILTVVVNAQKIFPNAIGFGTNSRGAYGGSTPPVVLTVNSLANSSVKTGAYSGSLEWCCSQNYPRIVVFAVSGVIDYTPKVGYHFINIKNPYISIYGQTSLGNGITLMGCELYVNTHDVLVQHLKIRQNEHVSLMEYRCVGVLGDSYNVVIDHCSLAFANDEDVTIVADRDITISNCLIAYPLVESIHLENNAPARHGFPSIDKANTNIAYIGNIQAFGIARHPFSDNGKCVIMNNFHWAVRNNNVSGPTIFNGMQQVQKYVIKGNKFLHSSPSSWTWYTAQIQGNVFPQTKIYLEDNISNMSINNPSFTEAQCVYNGSDCELTTTCPIDTTEFPSLTNAANVEEYLYANVGAFYWDRDYIDKVVIDNLKARDDKFINSPAPLPAQVWDFGGKIGRDLSSGYNFAANNVEFTVNGTTLRLTQNLDSQAKVIEALRSQLPEGVVVMDHPHRDCYFLMMKTTEVGSSARLTIGGDATVFGFENGTYVGTDGIGGYPNFSPTSHDLTADLGMPADAMIDSDGDGYTDFEEWVYEKSWLTTMGYKSTPLNNHDDNEANAFVIYPNPTTGKATIKFNKEPSTDIKLTVYNSAGSAVITKKYEPRALLQIDMENEPVGSLFVELIYENKKIIKKLVKYQN